MNDINIKKAIEVIIPTTITYLGFLNDFKIIKDMENWKPIIAAIVVCMFMIYIIYRRTQKEKLLDALQANIEKQRIAIEFMLSRFNLTDDLNKKFEKIKNNIKDNPALAKTLIDKD